MALALLDRLNENNFFFSCENSNQLHAWRVTFFFCYYKQNACNHNIINVVFEPLQPFSLVSLLSLVQLIESCETHYNCVLFGQVPTIIQHLIHTLHFNCSHPTTLNTSKCVYIIFSNQMHKQKQRERPFCICEMQMIK